MKNNIYAYGIRGEGRSATRRAMALMAEKRFDATKIYTHTFALADLPTALRYARDRVDDAIEVVVIHARGCGAQQRGGVKPCSLPLPACAARGKEPTFTLYNQLRDASRLKGQMLSGGKMAREPSGVVWVERFPTSGSTATLVDGFRQKCEAFLAALADAGATVNINATLRPPERAYLMHWSFVINAGEVEPDDVPPHAGVEDRMGASKGQWIAGHGGVPCSGRGNGAWLRHRTPTVAHQPAHFRQGHRHVDGWTAP